MLMNKINAYLYNTDDDDIDHVIAKFIKTHIDTIGDMTIGEVANACFVSQAKISKFCKRLGYDNFIALKDDSIQERKTRKEVKEIKRENLEIEYKKHIHRSLSVIENNLMHTDERLVSQLVQDIAKAKVVYLYGMGYSNLLCQYVVYESDFLNKEVIIIDEKINKEYHLNKDDLLIVLTMDGHIYELDERPLRRLKQYKVNKWIMTTDLVNKHILSYFDHQLVIPSKYTEIRDRQILLRYMIDIILGRYQYLYK